MNKHEWRVYRTRLSPSHCLAEESSSITPFAPLVATNENVLVFFKTPECSESRCIDVSTYMEENLLLDFKVMTKV